MGTLEEIGFQDGAFFTRHGDCSTPKNGGHTALCWLMQEENWHQFQGAENKTISYAAFDPIAAEGTAYPIRATVFLVPGWWESILRHTKTAYDLAVRNAHLGFRVVVIEHRGQGRSDRLVPDDGPAAYGSIGPAAKGEPGYLYERSYVDNFEYYADDLAALIALEGTTERNYAIAHSMGAAAVTRYLEREGDAAQLDRVALCAPMFDTPGLEAAFSGDIRNIDVILAVDTPAAERDGQQSTLAGLAGNPAPSDYALGQGAYEVDHITEPDPDGQSSLSVARVNFLTTIMQYYPEGRLGGTTYRWYAEAYRGMERIRNDAAKVTKPVILFHGDSDNTVGPTGHDTVCKGASDCTLVHGGQMSDTNPDAELMPVLSDAEHGLTMERDSVRSAVLTRAVEFLLE